MMGRARSAAWPWLPLLGLIDGAVEAVRVQPGSAAAAPTRDPYAAYDGLSLFKLVACSKEEVDAAADGLADSGCSFLSEPGQLLLPASGRCAEGLAVCPADLRTAFPAATLLADGTAGRYFRDRDAGVARPWASGAIELGRSDQAFYEAFRPYEDIVERVKDLVAHSRGVAELVPLSPLTHEQRRIHAVRLRGSGWRPGMPRAVFTYLLHAREWITAMAGVYAVDRAIEMALADSSFIRGMEVVFVPVSNPDGFKYSTERERYWRKNRRYATSSDCMGVDLNRNFEFAWSDSQQQVHSRFRKHPPPPRQCEEIYSGPKPASEPETQALQSLVREANLTVSIDFHSCGGYILGPWSYTQEPHPRLEEILDLGGQLQGALGQSGMDYHFCTGNRCLYPVPGNLADFGSSTGGLGFTVEMRPVVHEMVGMHDFAPPHDQILPNAEENYQAVLAALDFAKRSRA